MQHHQAAGTAQQHAAGEAAGNYDAMNIVTYDDDHWQEPFIIDRRTGASLHPSPRLQQHAPTQSEQLPQGIAQTHNLQRSRQTVSMEIAGSHYTPSPRAWGHVSAGQQLNPAEQSAVGPHNHQSNMRSNGTQERCTHYEYGQDAGSGAGAAPHASTVDWSRGTARMMRLPRSNQGSDGGACGVTSPHSAQPYTQHHHDYTRAHPDPDARSGNPYPYAAYWEPPADVHMDYAGTAWHSHLAAAPQHRSQHVASGYAPPLLEARGSAPLLTQAASAPLMNQVSGDAGFAYPPAVRCKTPRQSHQGAVGPLSSASAAAGSGSSRGERAANSPMSVQRTTPTKRHATAAGPQSGGGSSGGPSGEQRRVVLSGMLSGVRDLAQLRAAVSADGKMPLKIKQDLMSQIDKALQQQQQRRQPPPPTTTTHMTSPFARPTALPKKQLQLLQQQMPPPLQPQHSAPVPLTSGMEAPPAGSSALGPLSPGPSESCNVAGCAIAVVVAAGRSRLGPKPGKYLQDPGSGSASAAAAAAAAGGQQGAGAPGGFGGAAGAGRGLLRVAGSDGGSQSSSVTGMSEGAGQGGPKDAAAAGQLGGGLLAAMALGKAQQQQQQPWGRAGQGNLNTGDGGSGGPTRMDTSGPGLQPAGSAPNPYAPPGYGPPPPSHYYHYPPRSHGTPPSHYYDYHHHHHYHHHHPYHHAQYHHPHYPVHPDEWCGMPGYEEQVNMYSSSPPSAMADAQYSLPPPLPTAASAPAAMRSGSMPPPYSVPLPPMPPPQAHTHAAHGVRPGHGPAGQSTLNLASPPLLQPGGSPLEGQAGSPTAANFPKDVDDEALDALLEAELQGLLADTAIPDLTADFGLPDLM